jgi:DNA gyrase subunit B
MLSSDEIKTMIAALGCGIGTEDFDIDKLRYHRIIIMTDADVDGSHIRTLLLTFFYRQMPLLVERGHVHIAQPPLYRAKRGRVEKYIKDDRELADGTDLSGPGLEKLLHGMKAYQKVLQAVERRGHARDVIEAFLDRDVRDRSFFENEAALHNLALQLTTPTRDVSVVRDDEHNAWQLTIDDRATGYSRFDHLGLEFVRAGEYRTLAQSYAEVKNVVRALRTGPVEIRVVAAARVEEEPDEAVAGVDPEDGGGPAVAKVAVAARGPVHITSLDQFVDHFIALGRKGVAINRYKGLGEMNPDTLWETTMNPEKRTLLQVRAEDHTEADSMFTTLMGDQVEPRRRFIEDNALDVRNLDI